MPGKAAGNVRTVRNNHSTTQVRNGNHLTDSRDSDLICLTGTRAVRIDTSAAVHAMPANVVHQRLQVSVARVRNFRVSTNANRLFMLIVTRSKSYQVVLKAARAKDLPAVE